MGTNLDFTILGAITNATVTIQDNDSELGFAFANFSVNENVIGGSAVISAFTQKKTYTPPECRVNSITGLASRILPALICIPVATPSNNDRTSTPIAIHQVLES